MSGRIAIITAGGAAPAIIINRLKDEFPDLLLINEKPESKSVFLKRRARKIGWYRTLAQLPTQFLSKFTKSAVSRRYTAIESEFGVSMDTPRDIDVLAISSVNDGMLGDILKNNGVILVFVVGARMFTKATLTSIEVPILNFHAGFTPDYRGLNGGYWALVEGRPERFGGTIHHIDQGVDTGDVIAQVPCVAAPDDSLMTYQHTISAQCVQACSDAIRQVLAGTAQPFQPVGKSKQHYHPTIQSYLWTVLTRKIW